MTRQEMITEIGRRFAHEEPHGDQPYRYNQIRSACRDLAELIVEITPQSREQSLALTALEEVSMWANKAIGRSQPT